MKSQMKIKIFNKERIAIKDNLHAMKRFKLETNEQLENRINEFIADKEVFDIKYQEATYGSYEDLDNYLTIIVMYKETTNNK